MIVFCTVLSLGLELWSGTGSGSGYVLASCVRVKARMVRGGDDVGGRGGPRAPAQRIDMCMHMHIATETYASRRAG